MDDIQENESTALLSNQEKGKQECVDTPSIAWRQEVHKNKMDNMFLNTHTKENERRDTLRKHTQRTRGNSRRLKRILTSEDVR